MAFDVDGSRLRPAEAADLPPITRIYGHHVATGLGSFEEVPPSLEEMARRFEAVRRQGLPYLVAEVAGAVAGYAYAGPFRPRPAYRHTVEDSVYIDPAFAGRGLGRALVAELIEACTRLGYRQMVAVIGDSGNLGSIRLHESLGFRRAGVLVAVGFKLGRWVDSVLMQRALGEGDGRPPGASPGYHQASNWAP